MSSFLEDVHTELSSLWKSIGNKGDQFAVLFKGVVDKVGQQVETEAKTVEPEVKEAAETVATDAEDVVETAVEDGAKDAK